MRRWMFSLGLIAALGGSPLRLVEAADDLARLLAHGAERPDFEEVDGGVGDDSGAAIKSAPAVFLPCGWGDAAPPAMFLPPARMATPERGPASTYTGSTADPRRSSAWLQRFLF